MLPRNKTKSGKPISSHIKKNFRVKTCIETFQSPFATDKVYLSSENKEGHFRFKIVTTCSIYFRLNGRGQFSTTKYRSTTIQEHINSLEISAVLFFWWGVGGVLHPAMLRGYSHSVLKSYIWQGSGSHWGHWGLNLD